MSFQAYLDNIKTKTGKGPEDFRKLAAKKGLLDPGIKASEVVAWLKKDFDLGHGHAMAIFAVLKGNGKKEPVLKGVDKHFDGTKSEMRTLFDQIIKTIHSFGEDISIAPAGSYISVLCSKKKIAVIQVTTKRMDIGIKLKGVAATKRFAAAGRWNTMVTHRVTVITKHDIDSELFAWLQSAYEQVRGA